jgi:hypothetical protein
MKREDSIYLAPFRKSSLDEEKAKIYIGNGSTDTPPAHISPYACAMPAAP